MKKSFILHLLLINVFISSLHAENMLTKVRDYFYTTRLFAGYHSSPAEKAAAKEKLKQLSTERIDLQNSLATSDNEQEKQTIRTKLAEINKQIDQQKIILGQKMTRTRKLIWLGTGLLGLAALGGAEVYFRESQSYIHRKAPVILQQIIVKRRYADLTIEQLIDKREKINKAIHEKYTEQWSLEGLSPTIKKAKKQNLDTENDILTSELEDIGLEINRRENKAFEEYLKTHE